MPRVSIRKLFVYLLAVASCVLLALNIQQRATGLFTSSLTPSGPSGPPAAPASSIKTHEDVVKQAPAIVKPKATAMALDGKSWHFSITMVPALKLRLEGLVALIFQSSSTLPQGQNVLANKKGFYAG